MSFPQYKDILSAVNEKISKEVRLSALSLSGEWENEFNPLYSEDSVDVEERVFRMSDALKLQSMANG